MARVQSTHASSLMMPMPVRLCLLVAFCAFARADMRKDIEYAKAGANLIMHSSDLTLFSRTLKNEIEALRKALD